MCRNKKKRRRVSNACVVVARSTDTGTNQGDIAAPTMAIPVGIAINTHNQ
jgi:hypothetical protein